MTFHICEIYFFRCTGKRRGMNPFSWGRLHYFIQLHTVVVDRSILFRFLAAADHVVEAAYVVDFFNDSVDI